MKKHKNLKFWLLIFTALFFSMYQDTQAQTKGTNKNQTKTAQMAADDIMYTVSMPKPWTHLIEVEMRLNMTNMPAQAEIKMPVWTPGSYLIREYARHVQDFEAMNSSGQMLDWRKTNKNTWQIDTKGAKEIVAKYKVYANELTVRTNELNSDHGFWTNAALLMFPKDGLKMASTVVVKPYGDWKVATGLPPVANQVNTFRAENFDILYDSPFEVSNFTEKKFTVKGKPHRFIMSGKGNYDLDKIARDVTKIVEQAYDIFGELPYDNYTYIVNLRGGGGLEHLNSTALQWDKFGFEPESRYDSFLGLVAHEYFHLWNVKRIRPDALGPFDYENENYTRLLWVAEGATSYYESLLMRRAGLRTDKQVLSGWASNIAGVQRRPGRFETSLEDASFDAWIKYYRQDENSINNQVSYYNKGEVVNFLLDVKIREMSKGTKSLDDVMRALYNDFFKKGKNYTPADYQRICETMAGGSLEEFFDDYVRGTKDIAYNEIFDGVGLKLLTGAENSAKETYLGASVSETDGRLTIRALPSDSPAYEWGLNTGDQIVAIDGYRATQSFLQTYIGTKKPGDKVMMTIFRFDELREMPVTLGGDTKDNFRFTTVSNPSDEQKRLYKSYLLSDL